MERGIVKSYSKGGGGFISRPSDTDVQFYTDGVLSKCRSSLKPGDAVWFEVDCVRSLHVAMNIRKC